MAINPSQLNPFGNFNLGLGTIGNVLVLIFASLLIVGLIGGIIAYIFYRKTYSQNIYIFGLLGNKPTLRFVDKAKVMKFGSVGDVLFFLQKKKKYITPPTIQIAPNTWWYWERPDGELINFTLGDIDEDMRKAGITYIDNDMRMQRLGIEKNLRDRFEKIGFWAKYGATIMALVFVIMVTIALVVLFSKLVDVSKALESNAKAVENMATVVNKFYDEKLHGGTPTGAGGLTPAGGT